VAERAVKFLTDNALAAHDQQYADLISTSVIKLSTELLDSPLRAAFATDREKLAVLTTRFEGLGLAVERARSQDDLKARLASEDEQMAAAKAAMAANADLRRLISDPKFAELFLDGQNGALATARAKVDAELTKAKLSNTTASSNRLLHQVPHTHTHTHLW
jgi:hypothetical protein